MDGWTARLARRSRAHGGRARRRRIQAVRAVPDEASGTSLRRLPALGLAGVRMGGFQGVREDPRDGSHRFVHLAATRFVEHALALRTAAAGRASGRCCSTFTSSPGPSRTDASCPSRPTCAIAGKSPRSPRRSRVTRSPSITRPGARYSERGWRRRTTDWDATPRMCSEPSGWDSRAAAVLGEERPLPQASLQQRLREASLSDAMHVSPCCGALERDRETHETCSER